MDRKVLQYIDDHEKEYVELLQTLCRQPSIAGTGEGIQEMIQLVVSYLRRVGAEPVLCETKGNPVIYAAIPGESEHVFGFYDHYDVQPVDPIDQWISAPYSAEIRDGVLYARGAADNKNGIASKLAAVDAWRKVYGRLPCGVKFFVEGEEEIGSPNLEYFAEHYEDLLDCDGFNWESGWKEVGGAPEINLGSKGLLYVELKVKTAANDVHSAYAAVLPSAAWRLVEVLRAIKDPATDRILIPGFYDDVIPPTQDDLQNLAEDNFDEEGLRQFWGVDHYINHLHGVDLLKKLYYEPTANICGMESGYNGEGGKTVMPAEASAKIDFRLVPGQQPEKILNLLKSYLHQKGFDDVEVIADSGQAPYRSVPDSAFVKAVYRTLDGLFGKPVVHYMLTGTSPMPVFCAKKHIPAAMFGGTSTKANIHAPNEHIAISSYMDEIKMIAGVMEELGRQG